MAQGRTAEDRKTEVEGYLLFPVKQAPAQLLGVQIAINPQPLPPSEVEGYDLLTRQEVKAFGAKLDALGNSLSANEQALLREILLRAAQHREVIGYRITATLPPTDPPVSFSELVTSFVSG